jgi:hypothetical protein
MAYNKHYMITKTAMQEGTYFLGCTNLHKEGVICKKSMQIGQQVNDQ